MAGALGLPGCGADGGSPAAPRGPLVLEPVPETIRVRPGEQGAVRFVLLSASRQPVPMQRVSFVIVDDPGGSPGGSQSRGATLSAASAATDGGGVAQIDVTAGQAAVFRIRASFRSGPNAGNAPDPENVLGSAEAEVVVVVATEMVASVEIAPFLTPGSAAAGQVARIEILFFDNTTCRALSSERAPIPARTVRSVPAHDGAAQYDYVSTALSHAVSGRASDARGSIAATGCVDLPGTVLVSGGVVRVALPLDDASPSPLGHFSVTSRFNFTKPLAATPLVAAPWRDLQDCPLDPAQLWLDCTIDALSGPQPGDPIDCAPRPGEEGVLGVALDARRGTFLSVPAGQSSSCRGSADPTGGISHDALVTGLFGSPKPKAIVDLAFVADDAQQVMSSLLLRSQLTVRAAEARGTYAVTHLFTAAGFSVLAATYEVPLLPLALPVLEVAGVSGRESAGALMIDTHGITIRFGTVARLAFGELALARRGLPAETRPFLNALFNLAKAPLRVTAGDPPPPPLGCAALDDVLCRDIGRPKGCVAKACEDGLAALAARLDAGFTTADGEAIDLILGGSAPLLDPRDRGFADRLGDAFAMPGLWTAKLATRAGNESVSGTWDGFRNGE
jgi:hypothetical protein